VIFVEEDVGGRGLFWKFWHTAANVCQKCGSAGK
jgi:hypothetical protein